LPRILGWIAGVALLASSAALLGIGRGDAYRLGDLAFPHSVDPGQVVNFTVPATGPPVHIWLMGPAPNQPVLYRSSIDGRPWADNRTQSSLGGAIVLLPGNWSHSFESQGTIAVAYYLPELCGWTTTSSNLEGAECPEIQISAPTAFELTTWVLDRPYQLRVSGHVDAYLFDNRLSPLGQFTERTFQSEMRGLVVVVPRDATAAVNFEIAPAPPSPLDLAWVWAAAVAVFFFVLVAVWLWTRRRQRRAEKSDPRLEKRGPRGQQRKR